MIQPRNRDETNKQRKQNLWIHATLEPTNQTCTYPPPDAFPALADADAEDAAEEEAEAVAAWAFLLLFLGGIARQASKMRGRG